MFLERKFWSLPSPTSSFRAARKSGVHVSAALEREGGSGESVFLEQTTAGQGLFTEKKDVFPVTLPRAVASRRGA